MDKEKRKKIEKASIRKQKSSKEKKNISFPEIHPLLIFCVLLIYFVYFINIDYFYDWDTLSTSIAIKSGEFEILKNFTSYHMLTAPLVYIVTKLISLFYGWEPLVGWKILILLTSAGSVTILYITLCKITKNWFNSLIATMALAGTYGFLFLTLSLEDNIVNSFFNMVFIFFLLAQLGEVKLEILQEKNKMFLPLATGVALGLAIATHIHSMLFTLLVPTIFYFKHKNGISNNFREILIVAAGSLLVIAPILVLNAYVYHWNSIQNLISFFSIGYHNNPNLYYFSNPARDVWKQFEYVNWGLTSLFFQRYNQLSITPGFLEYSKYLLLALGIVFCGFVLSSIRTITTQIMLLMFLIMIPHSLFYESWNIERWDSILLPMYIIIGRSMSIESVKGKNPIEKIQNFYSKHGVKIACTITIILFFFSISSFYELSHFQKNPVHILADEINKRTQNDAVVILNVRSTSELGMYVKYRADRELKFLSDYTPEEIMKYIEFNISKRPIYISAIAAENLIQPYPDMKTNYSYAITVDNGNYSLYRMSKPAKIGIK
jgi:hypothetical protein